MLSNVCAIRINACTYLHASGIQISLGHLVVKACLLIGCIQLSLGHVFIEADLLIRGIKSSLGHVVVEAGLLIGVVMSQLVKSGLCD